MIDNLAWLWTKIYVLAGGHISGIAVQYLTGFEIVLTELEPENLVEQM